VSDPPTRRDDDRPSAYDDRDIDARAISRFSLGVLALCVFSFGAAYWLVEALSERVEERYPEPPIAATARPTVPEGPLLQARPEAGLAILRAQEEARLEQYAWIDRGEGVVRIPIERAMDLIAERGLPVRDEPAPVVEPISQPTESGLGIPPAERRETTQ
jgi:hypothetical protein